jgi:hypothetical protein
MPFLDVPSTSQSSSALSEKPPNLKLSQKERDAPRYGAKYGQSVCSFVCGRTFTDERLLSLDYKRFLLSLRYASIANAVSESSRLMH